MQMSNAIKLLAQYETDMLKSKLRTFPSIIKAQKQKVRDAREEFKETDQMRAIHEADLMTDINAEKDPVTGKAMFSNDKTRQAELLRRKQNDFAYQEAERAAKAAQIKLNEAEDELDRLIDEFKSYRYIVGLTTQELALLASEEREIDSESATYQTASTKEPY
ncbi:MAG: hypothetical protein PWQ67_2595 [Clostridia bacterium]|nr:hypothetical protein [Clostridia bacterium]